MCVSRLKILSVALVCAVSAVFAQEGDMRAYDKVRQAASMIRGQRYAEALHILNDAATIGDAHAITRTQIDAGRIRAAIGLGDYALAKKYYVMAMADSPDEEADDMLRLVAGELYFATGDFDRALAVADSVSTPVYALTRAVHRVRALTMLQRYGDAVAAADSALDACSKSDRLYAPLLQNRGYALWERGDAAAAADDLRAAAGLCSDPTDRLNMLGNLAMAESEAGNHVAAIRAVNEAVAGLADGTPDGITARRKRAEVLYRAGRVREAVSVFKRFFRSERKALLANLPSMPPSQRLNYWCREKPLLSRCFIVGDSEAEFLYEVALLRRQTSLLGMRDTCRLQELLSIGTDALRMSLAADEAAVEIVGYAPERGRNAYAAVILPRRGKARFVHLMDEDEIYEPETVGTNSLYNAVRRESREEKNLLYGDSLWGERVWRPILSVLPDGVHHVYFAPEGIFHLWGIENMPFAGKEKYVLHRVSSTALLATRVKSSARRTRRRMLAVGGLDYNAVPSGAPAGSGNGEAADVLRSRTGNRGRFTYLKGTRVEADSIGRIEPGADVRHVMGEAELKDIMPAYDVVHIATHGYSLSFGLRRRPEFLADSVAIDRSLLASGLALSGANAGYSAANGEDGLLSAREICDMNLSGVDFVVLSACRTALGDVSDEGAAGLVRGLKMAGAKCVMASLWEVDDMSTMLFMQAFYNAIDSGMPARDAYLSAQRRVREEPVRIAYRRFSPSTLARERGVRYRELPPFAEPYFWAPFIMTDDFDI